MEAAGGIALGMIALVLLLRMVGRRFKDQLEDAGLPRRLFPGGRFGPEFAARGEARFVPGELRSLDPRSCEIFGPTGRDELRTRVFARTSSTTVDEDVSVGDWVWVEHRGETLLGLTKDDPRSAR